ncbi:helix-turn-helix domain-containing protein [Nocardia sp. NBC_01499]|uniref:ParB N-terminal domain-containing protein n=1 Tax=Nocardia sp. NBC_01499 TaxID=2903597 RepID=UPI003866C945
MTSANSDGIGHVVDVEFTDREVLHAVELVPIDSVRIGETPRLAGEIPDYVRLIASLDITLPPIIIHRSSMSVVDGVHRLRAARLRGETQVAAVFFDGDEMDAFVVAVKANIAHGMPLTLADRTAAAVRILSTHPQWSDGFIAACTGLATKTVAAIRRRSGADLPGLHSRLGLDGKMRPTDPSAGRMRAARLIADRPDASLREIAREAGVSPATVRDVRARLQRGEPPVPSKSRRSSGSDTQDESPELLAELLRGLQKHPAVRFSESGRILLRLLGTQPLDPESWDRMLAGVPSHCDAMIARIARQYAANWQNFANELAKRTGRDTRPGPDDTSSG